VAFKNNKIAGIIGKWDQSKYKQIIVSEYHGPIKIFRPIINGALNLLGFKPLPGRDEQIKIFYLSFICISNNDMEIMRMLLDKIYQDYKEKEYHYMLAAFHERDPLISSVKGYFYYTYKSRLYLVCWPENLDYIKTIQQELIPYIDPAIL
jgi:hypothetical protein